MSIAWKAPGSLSSSSSSSFVSGFAGLVATQLPSSQYLGKSKPEIETTTTSCANNVVRIVIF